uniref:Uncharacterized protein n=1 Tax=virus sp. ctkyY8 TaxID=2827995 RepID=A0A8S5REB6_9VIRU|nr:MAG TPA: hypothetical protein [virus sp. ctkyY8]
MSLITNFLQIKQEVRVLQHNLFYNILQNKLISN